MLPCCVYGCAHLLLKDLLFSLCKGKYIYICKMQVRHFPREFATRRKLVSLLSPIQYHYWKHVRQNVLHGINKSANLAVTAFSLRGHWRYRSGNCSFTCSWFVVKGGWKYLDEICAELLAQVAGRYLLRKTNVPMEVPADRDFGRISPFWTYLGVFGPIFDPFLAETLRKFLEFSFILMGIFLTLERKICNGRYI